MPDTDFEVIRRAWAAFSRRDEDALRGELHPTIQVVSLGAVMDGKAYRGADEVILWWREELLTHWDVYETIPEDFRRVGERILVTGRWHARASRNGLELEMPATWILEMRDGKIAAWRTYTDRSEGLRELMLDA